jgi:hypothetical protein
MPRGRKPHGDRALTNAERQARHRSRQSAQQPAVTVRYGKTAAPRTKPANRSRPQRWQQAIGELIALQADYRAWLAVLPESLQDSPTAQALQAIVEIDLDELAAVEPPRGYGRD